MPNSRHRDPGRAPFHSLALALLLATFAFAFTPRASLAGTGTVVGKVVDDDGNAVPDAIVVVPELKIGTRTNGEGRYTISQVPVGSWLLHAAHAGKKPINRTIQVDAGTTTVADFALAESPYRIPAVTVVGRTEIAINKTQVETKTHITKDQIDHLPFDEINQFIGLTAGVISMKGELHFHAGRGDEVLTLIDGIPSRNALQSQSVDLGLLSLAGSEQILGGISAQYGNALSGVISLTTREGGDKFGGEVRYFTDRYGEEDKSFNDFERLSAGVGGPFFFPNTSYYVSFQGTYTDTYLRNTATHREHRFLDFIRIGNRQSNAANLSSKITWRATPNEKLNLEVIRNASVNGRFHNRWNRNGYVRTFADSTAPTDGNIGHRYGAWSWFPVDSTYIPMNTAEHLPIRDDDYQQVSLSWRHTLGRDEHPTIYNVRASRQEWKSVTDVLDRQPWEYQQVPSEYYDSTTPDGGLYYVTNGDYPFLERRETITYTLNGDLTKNVHGHVLMLGGEFNKNHLQYLFTQFPNTFNSSGSYGGTRDDFQNSNPEGSVFAQDRWQFEGLVLNAGVRYDAFSVGNQLPAGEVRDPVKTQWSPRIGIAHPISDRDVMSFYYGRLFQVPDRIYIYQGRTFSAEVRGNPNLEPETTISYQLGVQHLFTSEIYAQFSVYFKDMFGLLTTVPQEVPGVATEALTYVNGDYASARGIDVTLIKERSHGFSGEVNYTYGNASGTASDPNRALPSSGNLRDQYKPTSEQPLRWDQRHTLSATLRLGDEKSWGASFVYQFGTGLPFTPTMRQQRRQDPSLVNSGRLPPTSNLSVQAERMFHVWDQRVTLYLQGTNILDVKDISELQPDLWPDNVQVSPSSYNIYYTETGRAGGAYLGPDRDGNGIEDWIPVRDPRVFEPGRVLRVGLGVVF